MSTFDERLRQAQALATLVGQAPPAFAEHTIRSRPAGGLSTPSTPSWVRVTASEDSNAWTEAFELLARFKLDRPEDWENLTIRQWTQLLIRQPSLADKVPDRKTFKRISWGKIVAVRPELADRVPNWNRITGDSLLQTMYKAPQLAHHVTRWGSLHVSQWLLLLHSRPELAQYKPKGPDGEPKELETT